MTEQTCTSCAWWADLGDSIGQCRRHAPRPRTSTDEVVWPTTDSDDYCGEWEEADEETCDCDDDETCELCADDRVDEVFDAIVDSLISPPRRRWWHRNKGE